MARHKEELMNRLQHLGIAFVLMVVALVIAAAWTSIAASAGLMPTVTTGGVSDDGKDGATVGTGDIIPGANANNGIDDSTEQVTKFVTDIVKWITGIAGALLAVALLLIGLMHMKETDPNKRD